MMPNRSMPIDYAALAARAEASVESVKDPELKKLAFAKILDSLLNGSGTVTDGPMVEPSAARVKLSRGSDRPGPMNYILELVSDGFFDGPKSIADVREELRAKGHFLPLTSLSGPLQRLCQRKTLRRERGVGGVFAYSMY
jgi:hypothetical protein